jgi:hypothetical protein
MDSHQKKILSNPKKDVSHLKQYQWKKGNSGNRKGKPKGSQHIGSFKELLERVGQQDLIESPIVPRVIKKKFFSSRPITMKNAVVWIVYLAALSGKDWAARFIVDYTEGKPKEFHEIVKHVVKIDIDDESNEELKESEEFGIDEEQTIIKSDDDDDCIDFISDKNHGSC